MENNYFRGYPPPFRFSPYYYKQYNPYARINSAEKYTQEKNTKKEKHTEQACFDSKRNPDFSNRPIFELFGISLFFDDVLLISLIFFLYNENVQDPFLFIALILLLLS